MKSRDFAYWLQGYFELMPDSTTTSLSPAQVECIRKHLALVFLHDIDPSAGGPEEQKKLNEAHEPAFHPIRPDLPDGVKIRC